MAASLIGSNPNIKVVSITDFTPGVHQFGRGGYSTTYSSTMPVGSASLAVRCIAEPNVGLVPFYGYTAILAQTAPSGNSPAGHPITKFLWTGHAILQSAVGPNPPANSLGATSQSVDYLLATNMYSDSAGNVYSDGERFASTDGVTPFNSVVALWANRAVTSVGTTSFAQTSQYLGGAYGFPYPMLVFTNGNVLSAAFPNSPVPYVAPSNDATVGAEWRPLQSSGFFNLLPPPDRVIAHSGRVLALQDQSSVVQGTSLYLSSQTLVFYTDPPFNNTNMAATFISLPNLYAVEEPSGIGGWGSVSTGELILINRGGGGLVVSGDAGFPSDVNRLPALPGTGQITQHMVACSQGSLYVTETDGVYAWNGGNTAIKVSNQLSDDTFTVASLAIGGFGGSFAVAGPRVQNAVFNDRVFFPHNWVFDARTGSWWQAEDTAVVDLSFWAASGAYTGKMYGQVETVLSPGAAVHQYGFDPSTAATTWRWVSNPIPSGIVGGLPTLDEVEICATNPTSQPATVKLTPTVVAGTSTFGNNPQSVTFTIPAHTYGYRAAQPLGYSEQNMCIQVDAAGSNDQSAPTVHEIHLGFTPIRTSGI